MLAGLFAIIAVAIVRQTTVVIVKGNFLILGYVCVGGELLYLVEAGGKGDNVLLHEDIQTIYHCNLNPSRVFLCSSLTNQSHPVLLP